MGCSSSGLTNATPENFCGDGDVLGMESDVNNSCFFTTDLGTYCANTGLPHQQPFGQVNGSTEWVLQGPGSNCGVCSGCSGVEQGNGNGLCSSGCSWAGVRQRCRRVAFNGDPTACCRRSVSLNGQNLFCFQDNSKAKTCDPQYRGFLKPACIGVMATYCSNDSETGYKDKWTGTPSNRDCLRFVQENTGNLDAYGPVIEAMVTRYLVTDNNPITSPETSGSAFDPFITQLISVCRGNPGACDNVLKQKCAGVKRADLANNVNLANLCGCFMPDIEYSSFSEFGITRECDPVCTLGTSVHVLDPGSAPPKTKECKQSICVIDDVTINILAKSVTGDITFAQACGSCAGAEGGGSCRCYINDTTITAVDSLIGDVTFSQQCGGAPLCYKSAPVVGAPPIQVDCNSGQDIPTSGGTTTTTEGPVVALWVAFAIVALIFLFAIILALRGRSTKPRRTEGPIFIPAQESKSTRPMLGSLGGASSKSRSPIESRGISRR